MRCGGGRSEHRGIWRIILSESSTWLLLDVGNSAIKWRLATCAGLLSEGGRAEDITTLRSMLDGCDWQHVAVASWRGRLPENCHDLPCRVAPVLASEYVATIYFRSDRAPGDLV